MQVDKIILVLWDNKDKACYNNALKAWVPKTISVMKEFGLVIDEPASKKSKESQNDDSDAEGMQVGIANFKLAKTLKCVLSKIINNLQEDLIFIM